PRHVRLRRRVLHVPARPRDPRPRPAAHGAAGQGPGHGRPDPLLPLLDAAGTDADRARPPELLRRLPRQGGPRLHGRRAPALAAGLAEVRDRGGRLFILGVGGSAAHAGHAVNDFRKLCAFEAYAPTDNVSELTARVNDDGWDTSFSAWLAGSRLSAQDAVLVF